MSINQQSKRRICPCSVCELSGLFQTAQTIKNHLKKHGRARRQHLGSGEPPQAQLINGTASDRDITSQDEFLLDDDPILPDYGTPSQELELLGVLPDNSPSVSDIDHLGVYFLSTSALLLSHMTSITNGSVLVNILREMTSKMTSEFGIQRGIQNICRMMLSSRMASHEETKVSRRISSRMHYRSIQLFSTATCPCSLMLHTDMQHTQTLRQHSPSFTAQSRHVIETLVEFRQNSN
ncbi:hypothetical protein DEU56DRAFT_339133 [Suillus clintonianus]|uniref:uncharacterized protein n=1 Tax=Suillus clintonianus TaxID=1904413 RepID=UPI001B8802EC|nr:uncharacterized protein DEU56DRAFT_339133 [Suillus clintonianus]KAG2138291.1 hypothetical protein DEU56DRAFT_339133 [Suillus clintonianus]